MMDCDSHIIVFFVFFGKNTLNAPNIQMVCPVVCTYYTIYRSGRSMYSHSSQQLLPTSSRNQHTLVHPLNSILSIKLLSTPTPCLNPLRNVPTQAAPQAMNHTFSKEYLDTFPSNTVPCFSLLLPDLHLGAASPLPPKKGPQTKIRQAR